MMLFRKKKTEQEEIEAEKTEAKRSHTLLYAVFAVILCLSVFATALASYFVVRDQCESLYGQIISSQSNTISELRESLSEEQSDGNSTLSILSEIVEEYGYYSDEVSEEERMIAAFKAYMEATGDKYAEYYTEEEFAELSADNSGDYCGIGVTVLQTVYTYQSVDYLVYLVVEIYEDSPANATDLQIGDMIYAVKKDDTFQTISQVGGFNSALNLIRGEEGTNAEFKVLRESGETINVVDFSITRKKMTSQSVLCTDKDKDALTKTARIRISNFDLTTPHQFRDIMDGLLQDGYENFIFDVRNNPGGVLQSIKATLTYFLSEGDLILKSIDKDGNVGSQYVAEVIQWTGTYEAVNVSQEEIGKYKGLNCVVLCNGNTASAAEVFTATMQDYGIATIVGVTTYGKGIMQSYIPFSAGSYTGYAKLTTYAYVTKRDVTYHDVGITPDVVSELSEENSKKSLYLLAKEDDTQLQKAIEIVTTKGEE